MRLELLEVTIQWFRSFAEPQTLRLDLPGLWFMRGRNEVEPALGANGSGKSSVWDAVTWCLYARTASGLKAPDIKPWTKGKTPQVELLLSLDGKEHTITRTAVTNGLKIDGKEVGSEEAAVLVGMEFDVFVNTVLQAQGQPLFFDRTPKEKMQLFTDVLQLEKWEERSKRATERVRELERTESEINGELNATNTSIEQTQARLARTRQDSEAWEADRRDRVNRAEEELGQLKQELQREKQALGEAELAADSAGTELKALRHKVEETTAQIEELAQRAMRQQLQRDSARREVKAAEQEFAQLGSAKDCPTCGRPLKGTSLAKHQEELESKIETLRRDLAKAERAVQQASEPLTKAKDAHSRNAELMRELDDREDLARTEAKRRASAVGELTAQMRALEGRKAERKDERNPYVDQVAALRREVSQRETERDELQEDLSVAQGAILRAKFWVKGFKDVQLYVIAEVLEELELTTNAVLTEVGLHDWRVHYDVEKETKAGTIQRGLNVTILSPFNAQPVRWESWSGGEGQRLRIVGALALSEVLLNRAGITCNIEVLDEPTRHLSSAGVRDLCAFLATRAKETERTIWLVDHTAREGANFAGAVTVVKTKQGSRIEQ